MIPAFAVGRTQQLLYLIRELEEENRIPILPVFVDSPMAASATKLYLRHTEDHDLEMKDLLDERRNPLATKGSTLTRTIRESKNVSAEKGIEHRNFCQRDGHGGTHPSSPAQTVAR